MEIYFEWDDAKAKSNLAKHGVAFEDAKTALSDPGAVVSQDRIESGELRWQTLGMVNNHVILFVAHLIKEQSDGSEVMRIISARNTDRKERKRYYENQND